MQLYQPQEGYCYNSDTIFLYDFIDSFSPRGRMLDVGAGCGVLGLLVARDNPHVRLEAVELQEEFAFFAQKNARVNGIDYTLYHRNFLAFDDSDGFAYIVSNPPFYNEGATPAKKEAIAAARSNISMPLEGFLRRCAKLLKPHGHLFFCYDAAQLGLIGAIVSQLKMRIVDIRFIHPKVDRGAKVVLLHVRKNSKALLKVHPPLIAFEGERFSSEARRLYQKARTHSIKCHI